MICLIFPDMQPTPMKVVFTPSVDTFEMLQISGFFDAFVNLT